MGLGKGRTEHSGPRDMSRKGGRWGTTEEAKAWASRARRRDEADDLRREVLGPGDPTQLGDELTLLWQERWPACRPIGHELRDCAHDRWIRFHSLPKSKRYPEDDDEYGELLHRHHTVIDDLRASTRSDELVVITASWSGSERSVDREPEVAALLPGEPWVDVLRETDEDGDEFWTHLFVARVKPDAAGLDGLLRLVAVDQTTGVIITEPGLRWLYHPYDGGADVICSDADQRDDLRGAHPAWLSPNPSGL